MASTSATSNQIIAVYNLDGHKLILTLNSEGEIFARKLNPTTDESKFILIEGLPEFPSGSTIKEIKTCLKTYDLIESRDALFYLPKFNSSLDVDSRQTLRQWLDEHRENRSLNFDNFRITSSDLKAILTWTKIYPHYTLISFNAKGLFRGSLEDVGLLSELIMSNPSVTSLNLFGNYLGDDGISKIYLAIKNHPSLTELKLGSNQIGNAGLSFILPLIGESSKIKVLILSSNLITDEMLDPLIKTLQQNSSLKQLNLKENRFSEEGKARLSRVFENSGITIILSSSAKDTKRNQSLEKTSKIDEKGKEKEEIQIPGKFICPLSRQLMLKPVIAPDGETYEEEMIRRYMLSSDESPLNGEKFSHNILTSNKQLEREIKAFLDENPSLKNEIFVPEGLMRDCISSIKENNAGKLKRVLHQDKRLFTQNIQDNSTLIDLAIESSFEILETVLKEFPEENKPKLTHPLCIKVSETIGSKGLKLLIESLPGHPMTLEERLVRAMNTGSIPYVNAIFDLGAGANTPVKNGQTPFHHAAKLGNSGILSLVMEKGGSFKVKDDNGLTPSQLANNQQTIDFIERKRLEIKMRPILAPLFETIEKQEKALQVLTENQYRTYQALNRLNESITEEPFNTQKIREDLSPLLTLMRRSLLEGRPAETFESQKSVEIDAERIEFLQTNNLIHLLSETILLLENVKNAHKDRIYSQEAIRNTISNYASISLLMRAFHMLGALTNHKKFKEFHIPIFLVDTVKETKTLNAYMYRNQMMHYFYKFIDETNNLLQTIDGLLPILGFIKELKKGTDKATFQPISSTSLPIYALSIPYDNDDEVVKDKTTAIQHIKLFLSQLLILFREAKLVKKQGNVFWEHDGVLHAAIGGLCCAIGQRLRDLKEHHRVCYNEIISNWEKVEPNLIKKRKIYVHECEGTFFEIDRAMWGHAFSDDDEDERGMTNGKVVKQAAFELLKPSELWSRLEFAEKVFK